MNMHIHIHITHTHTYMHRCIDLYMFRYVLRLLGYAILCHVTSSHLASCYAIYVEHHPISHNLSISQYNNICLSFISLFID